MKLSKYQNNKIEKKEQRRDSFIFCLFPLCVCVWMDFRCVYINIASDFFSRMHINTCLHHISYLIESLRLYAAFDWLPENLLLVRIFRRRRKKTNLKELIRNYSRNHSQYAWHSNWRSLFFREKCWISKKKEVFFLGWMWPVSHLSLEISTNTHLRSEFFVWRLWATHNARNEYKSFFFSLFFSCSFW